MAAIMLQTPPAFTQNFQEKIPLFLQEHMKNTSFVQTTASPLTCGQVFDNVQRAVDFNQRNKGMDRMPSIAKKRLLRKK